MRYAVICISLVLFSIICVRFVFCTILFYAKCDITHTTLPTIIYSIVKVRSYLSVNQSQNIRKLRQAGILLLESLQFTVSLIEELLVLVLIP